MQEIVQGFKIDDRVIGMDIKYVAFDQGTSKFRLRDGKRPFLLKIVQIFFCQLCRRWREEIWY